MTAPFITLGHATRPIESFIALLKEHRVALVADVRTVPRSRTNPQFSREALEASLRDAGIRYAHLAALGGLRRPRPDSPNAAWQNTSFRGYADHMQTAEFTRGLEALLAFADSVGATAASAASAASAVPTDSVASDASDAPTGTTGSGARVALVCAEMVPWRCHRSLVADALLARGFAVDELIGDTRLRPHTLTPFARVEGNLVTYPPAPS